jgi:hypothetical protein
VAALASGTIVQAVCIALGLPESLSAGAVFVCARGHMVGRFSEPSTSSGQSLWSGTSRRNHVPGVRALPQAPPLEVR